MVLKKEKNAIVYLAAGLSSRFGGKIKQLVKVGHNGETLMEISLSQAIKAGFNKIIFIVGNLTETPFREKFGDNYMGFPVSYAQQKFFPEDRDRPWGTVDALCSIENIIDCPFVVCNGDDIYGENTFKILLNHLRGSDDSATIGYKLSEVLSEKGSVTRGIFEIKLDKVTKITETFNILKDRLAEQNLDPSCLCSQNIFALKPMVINLLKEKLYEFKQKHTGDRKIECILPTELSNLIGDGKIKMHLYLTTDKWVGVTNPGDEIIMRRIIDSAAKQ